MICVPSTTPTHPGMPNFSANLGLVFCLSKELCHERCLFFNARIASTTLLVYKLTVPRLSPYARASLPHDIPLPKHPKRFKQTAS
jgi:hypothetical protein